jgi:lipopolysaccharide/colanic/teichoic acid biosynthesis glycosyltransferase
MVKNPYDPIYRIQSYLIDGFYQIPLNSNIYTKFGRFLEKYQIVELFQLINVLKGEMSIVGNRPLPEKNHQKIKLINRWSYRYCSPSGITGIAQICNKNELTSKERINLEAKYSIIYMRNNFLILILDIYILYRTFLFVLFGVKLNKYKANTILNSILYN